MDAKQDMLEIISDALSQLTNMDSSLLAIQKENGKRSASPGKLEALHQGQSNSTAKVRGAIEALIVDKSQIEGHLQRLKTYFESIE